MIPTHTSADGVHQIAIREGDVLTAYRDIRGILTVGVGHTSMAGPPTVVEGLKISMSDSLLILSHDLAVVETVLNRIVAKLVSPISQNAYDALASLGFNIGVYGLIGSSVVRSVKAGDMAGAANAFLMWDDPPALLGRRKGERAQFLRPDSGPAPTPDPATLPTGAEIEDGKTAWIQTRLNAAGAMPVLIVDGDLGPKTREAIGNFQTTHRLYRDGIVGPETMAALSA